MSSKTKSKSGKSKKGTEFPMSKKDFLKEAPPIGDVTVFGQAVLAPIKEFTSGSVGYYANGKVSKVIDGKVVWFQVGCNVTAVGSKEAD